MTSHTIPGLTARNFQAGSRHSVPETPKLLQSKVETDSSFVFLWEAKGSKAGSFYNLSAKGNLIAKDDWFAVECSCPSFHNQHMEEVPNVCKHLHAALTSVIDKTPSPAAATQEEKKKPAATEKSKKNIGVIDLSTLDDSDNEEQSSKRAAVPGVAATTMRQVARKKRATGTVETPIKLLCTVQDAALRKRNDRNHWSYTQCRTLRELILGDNNNNNNDEPIQWLLIANYLVDFNFLLNEVPELVSIPNVVVFYGCEADPSNWLRAAAPNRADFVQLNPQGTPRSRTNPLRYSFRSGTHHTKMFLVGRKNSVRVVVHTANLIHCDIHSKAQAAYIEDFPIKTGENGGRSEFEATLVQYVESYGYGMQQRWMGDRSEQLTQCLSRYDFSEATGVLVPSVPGYYDLHKETVMGHLKLKQAIARYTMDKGSSRGSSSGNSIVCQFSSLGGMVSENYLHQLQQSMDTRLARLP